MCASSWAGWRGVGSAAALSLVRVGACVDELRLMGIGRCVLPIDVGEAGGDGGSLARKSSRTYLPPTMERMWRCPWGGCANRTMLFMESGGHLRDRRYSLVGRLVATKVRRF